MPQTFLEHFRKNHNIKLVKRMYNLHPKFGLLFKIEKFFRLSHIKTIGDM